MNVYIIRRRVRGWIWFTALLSISSISCRLVCFPEDSAIATVALRLAIWITFIISGLFALVLMIYYALVPGIYGNASGIIPASTSYSGNVKPSGARLEKYYPLLAVVAAVTVLALLTSKFMFQNRNPFQLAASGAVPEMQLALETDISLLSKRNKRGESLLIIAAKGGEKEMVELLLSKGADINVTDSSKRTALFHATNDPSVLQLLLKHGAVVTTRDATGQMPLHVAIHQKNIEVVELLLSNSKYLDSIDHQGDTPLILATREGVDVVDMLLTCGADPNKIDKIGESPLHHAARRGSHEIMETLIAAGANINAVSRQGWTALHIAAMNDSLAAVDVLLQAGMNVDEPGVRSESALFCAVISDYPATVNFLLKHGADVELRDDRGTGSLNLAISLDHAEIVSMLIQAGADIDAADGTGLTARTLLSMEKHKALISDL